MKRAVFLDRDSTIIHADPPVLDPDQVRLIQGAASAIASLQGLGYQIVVVSNQPDVADGSLSEPQVDAINQRVAEAVRQSAAADINRFYYCPYHPDASAPKFRRDHPWRKPQPGMWHQAAEDLGLDLSVCWSLGVSDDGVIAGHAAGTRTILLNDSAGADAATHSTPDFTARSLVEAVRLIAQQIRPDASLDLPSPEAEPRAAAPPAPPPEAPAPESADATVSPATGPPDSRRPFRPWTIQPVIQDNVEPEVETSPAPVATAPPPDDPPAPQEPAPSPEEPAAMSPVPADQRTHDLLERILQQVRTRRADEGDFSLFKLGAVLMQLFAAACVAFGLMNTTDPDVFTRFLLCGIMLQLVVITLLLAHWQK